MSSRSLVNSEVDAPVLAVELARKTKSQQSSSENLLSVLLQMISESQPFDLGKASEFLLAGKRQDSKLEEELVRYIRQEKVSGEESIRIIRILECVCTKSQLLGHLLTLEFLEHPRIRSKVVLTIGRLVQNAIWLREQLQDSNPRVRANAIEAIWDVRVPGAEDLFLKAVLDINNRVIGNAVYGLYRLGNPRAVSVLHSLLRHPDMMFRCTGLWLVAELGDPRFLHAIDDPGFSGGDAKENALRQAARQRVRDCSQSFQFAGSLTLHCPSFRIAKDRTRHATVYSLSSVSGNPFGPSELSALHFTIEENNQLVEDFDFRWISPTTSLAMAVIAPADLSVHSQALYTCKQGTIPDETVSLLRYLPSAAAGRKQRNWTSNYINPEASGGVVPPASFLSSTLQNALLKGFEFLNSSPSNRHLFVLLDRSVDEKIPATLSRMVRISNTTVHVVATPDANQDLCHTLTNLSQKSGGTFLCSSSADALTSVIMAQRAQHAFSCEISWAGAGQKAKDITIWCQSGCGTGNVSLSSSASQ